MWGPLTPGDPYFDPFWARANEAGITVVVHAGDSGYSLNGYAKEADAIIIRSRSDAEALREELRQKARAEADGIIRNAERQIQSETARALQQIRHEAVDISVAIAAKIIQRNLSKEDNERLIDDALKQIDAPAH